MRRACIALSFGLNGCFFGTYQVAETAGIGNMDGAIYADFPTTLTPSQKFDVERNFINMSLNAGGYFSFGVSTDADVGASVSGLGLGPFVKWDAVHDRERTNNLGFIPYLYYDFLNTHELIPRLDVVYSHRYNRFFSLYTGWQGFYAYKYQNYSVTATGPPGELPFLEGLHNRLFVGIDLRTNLKGFGGKTAGKNRYPYGMRLELGGTWFADSLGFYPVATMGVGLVGEAASGCLSILLGLASGISDADTSAAHYATRER